MRSTAMKTNTAPPYPCLKSYNRGGFIVLFTSKKSGTVVHTDVQRWDLGYHSDDWDVGTFIPYTGQITLQND